MRVIFLDIDGVLNADCDFGGRGCPNPFVTNDYGEQYCGICKTHVRYLKKIVDETDAKIVLVSSWKRDYVDYIKHGYKNKVGKYLYNKLRRFGLEIFDTTLNYDLDCGISRGYEITAWLNDHQDIESWIVLDDVEFEDYDFMNIIPHLVKLDTKYGLWAIPAYNAIYKLIGKKDQALISHEKFAKLFGEITEAIIPETEEQEITIIKPRVEETK